MATSVDHTPSPAQLKESDSSMDTSPLFNPASDKKFWSNLRGRIDAILEDRNRNVIIDGENQVKNVGRLDRAKRLKEESMLLLRGFDSISQTMSQLSNNLENALQGARDLAKPPTLTEMFHASLNEADSKEIDSKREDEKKGTKRKYDPNECSDNQEHDDDTHKEKEEVPKENKMMKRARNIAVSMAAKAGSLARELKSMKSDLCFMQERSALLEEENKRLRDGFVKGIRPEEDDLVRLQLEALLAEKSRLANENANLVRENQCLHQLVEYHQITSQDDLSESYDQVLQGMCLDFSSPPPVANGNDSEGYDKELTPTSQTNISNVSTSLDGCFYEENIHEEEHQMAGEW